MSLKVEITTQSLDKVAGTSKNSGKDFCFYKQTAHVFLNGEKYPEKFEITHDDEKGALPAGVYSVDIEKAVTVDRFNGLGLDGRKLVFRSSAEQAAK